MVAPMVRCLRANGHGDGHLRHHRRTAASDQAAVDQQHATASACGFDRGIHSGAARPNDEDVRFDPHRLTTHTARPLFMLCGRLGCILAWLSEYVSSPIASAGSLGEYRLGRKLRSGNPLCSYVQHTSMSALTIRADESEQRDMEGNNVYSSSHRFGCEPRRDLNSPGKRARGDLEGNYLLHRKDILLARL